MKQKQLELKVRPKRNKVIPKAARTFFNLGKLLKKQKDKEVGKKSYPFESDPRNLK